MTKYKVHPYKSAVIAPLVKTLRSRGWEVSGTKVVYPVISLEIAGEVAKRVQQINLPVYIVPTIKGTWNVVIPQGAKCVKNE